MTNAELVLGIDGGGTKTIAVLARRSTADNEQVLGRGIAGAANPHVVGIKNTCSVFDEVIAAAFEDAGIPLGSVASACVALAGGAASAVQYELQDWARRRGFASRFTAVHDAMPVLAAGTPAGWGIAVISGTGSLVFGCDPAGKTARAGGWGHLFGDEGSGYAVAGAALQSVAQATDATGPATLLTDLMLEKFAVDSPRAIVGVVYHPPWDRAAVASLAEVVCRAASQGDEVAGRLLQRAASALAKCAVAVSKHLKLTEQTIPLAMAGGLLTGDRGMRDRLSKCLDEAGFAAPQVTLVQQPVMGAVRLAVEALNR